MTSPHCSNASVLARILFALMLALVWNGGAGAGSTGTGDGGARWKAGSHLTLPASAVARGAEQDGQARVEARLLLDVDSGPERVGVLFRLAPGWHLYWRNPGEVGLPTELEWRAENARIGEPEWPAPQRFVDATGQLTSYGYEGEVLLASSLVRTPDVSSVSVDVRLLVCESECIPVAFSLSRDLMPSPDIAQVALERSFFDHFHAKVPVAPSLLGLDVTARYSLASVRPGDSFEASLSIRRCDRDAPVCVNPDPGAPAVFVSDLPLFEAVELSADDKLVSDSERDDALLLPLRGELANDLDEPLARLSGVLNFLGEDGALRSLEIDLPFPFAAPQDAATSASSTASASAPASAPAEPASPANDGRAVAILKILLLSLIGGLLLNAMPCVLPVLGIKVCSAAELAQHDPKELRRHGYAYAAGVFSSMAALSAVVVGLQAAGTQVGWGFQFQEPLFVAAVTSLVVLFALNLFGLFEIQISTGALARVGSESTQIARSFFDGLLCVVLATPCTAPFLGTAVGFAFAGGPVVIVSVFMAIAAGLAAPYSLICLVPAWSRFVPRPGNWMLRLRTGLGFLLLGTAVWLIWIFGASAGVDGVARLLALLVTLAFGAWLLGLMQSLALPRATVAMAAGLIVFSIVGLDTVQVRGETPAEVPASLGSWEPYDREAIERTLAGAQPVFVSFTADWCITCKVNERVALADARVERAFDELGFETFRGDWTQRDESIRAELARHGRAGVPLYLVYDPRRPDQPIVLPELLRVDTVLETLRNATRGLSPAG